MPGNPQPKSLWPLGLMLGGVVVVIIAVSMLIGHWL